MKLQQQDLDFQPPGINRPSVNRMQSWKQSLPQEFALPGICILGSVSCKNCPSPSLFSLLSLCSQP